MRGEKRNRAIKLDPITREYLEGQFQRRFHEAAIAHDANNLECLIQLGDIYTRQGHYEKGLEIDSKLILLCPDEPTFHYNQACSYALLHRNEKAIEALREAIVLGYDDFDHMKEDEYLDNVRGTDLFEELLAEMLER